MVQLPTKPITDTWVDATWSEFLAIADHPNYAKAKGYYFNQQMRIEAMGVGPDHASENGVFHVLLTLFCALHRIPIRGLVNCSYRKSGVREAQPDSSYYVEEQAGFAPQGRSIVNLDESPAPDLAVEIADSSLSDDLGKKRLLYEELGIREYWVVDVEKAQIIAFTIVENGSRRISTSEVIAGLEISLIQTALQQCRTLDDAQAVQWAMQHFSS